jgi:N utilization substance protein B
MTDSDRRPTPPPNETTPAASPKPSRGKSRRQKPKGGPSRLNPAQFGGNLPLHQSRVFAMQALYEDDLTHHGLDEILQHFGEHKRRDLVESFARLRTGARKVIETIGYLARNADRDDSGAGIALFEESVEKALRTHAQDIETADADFADEYLALLQDRARKDSDRILQDFRARAGNHLKQAVETGRDASAQPFAPDLDDDDPEAREADAPLAEMESAANRRLTETLAVEERESIDALMGILRRTVTLARGVEAQQAEIDPHIEAAAPAFPIPQLNSIDRAVMRVAVYELLFEPDVPYKAAVNEAVDIAKRYGGPNSGRFVNGVLRTISERLRPTA